MRNPAGEGKELVLGLGMELRLVASGWPRGLSLERRRGSVSVRVRVRVIRARTSRARARARARTTKAHEAYLKTREASVKGWVGVRVGVRVEASEKWWPRIRLG